DGTPESPTWEAAENARLARDADFGTCLEIRTGGVVERLRYMGEVPLFAGAFIEVAARVKAISGPLPAVRVAAWPGGAEGRGVAGLPVAARWVPVPAHGGACAIRAVIGRGPRPGVDLVWDERVLYAHVGIDLLGIDLGSDIDIDNGRAGGALVRIESIAVRDVTGRFTPGGRVLPGFEAPAPGGSGAAPVPFVRRPLC
ncbi:MAG TPA: hypothetical protein VFN28_14870, partial [Amaricoccus sp.]|nr:hypothetical protein [Amaricoccus sp.]